MLNLRQNEIIHPKTISSRLSLSQSIALKNIQALRAFAALSVVAVHAIVMWWSVLRNAPAESTHGWANGASGVDIFFVISGLVMTISSQKLIDHPDGWRIFMKRRVERIMPLYWILTSAKLMLTFAVPSARHISNITFESAVASYFFIPFADANGEVKPIIPISWTLSFEMVFYVVFAASLWKRVPILKFATPILLMVSLISIFKPPYKLGLFRTTSWPAITELCNAMVLEFVFGVVIGLILLRGTKCKWIWAIVIFAISSTLLMTLPNSFAHEEDIRVLTWGIPAAFLVFSLSMLEFKTGKLIPKSILLIGDASYSIYLSHGFVLPVVMIIMLKLQAKSTILGGLGMTLAAGLILSTIVGVIVFTLVERPIINFFKLRRAGGAVGAALAVE